MNAEEIRSAVAEACGWLDVRPADCVKGQVSGIPPKHISEFQLRDWVPNYPSDLNACAEMEKMLSEDEMSLYIKKICSVADAYERCEAFLRVKGLWKE